MATENFECSELSESEIALELESALQELGELEHAVRELPFIFEVKYRQSMQSIVKVNSLMIAQHQFLQSQLMETASSAEPQSQGVSSFCLVCLWKTPLMVIIGSGFVLISALLIGLQNRHAPKLFFSPSAPKARSSDLAPSGKPFSLQVTASESSWVEVQDLATREVLFIGELQAGEQRTIRMRQGLRIRSGRPDLLTVSIDGEPPTPFGDRQGLGWRTFKTAGA